MVNERKRAAFLEGLLRTLGPSIQRKAESRRAGRRAEEQFGRQKELHQFKSDVERQADQADLEALQGVLGQQTQAQPTVQPQLQAATQQPGLEKRTEVGRIGLWEAKKRSEEKDIAANTRELEQVRAEKQKVSSQPLGGDYRKKLIATYEKKESQLDAKIAKGKERLTKAKDRVFDLQGKSLDKEDKIREKELVSERKAAIKKQDVITKQMPLLRKDAQSSKDLLIKMQALEQHIGFKLEDYDPEKHDIPGISLGAGFMATPGEGRVSKNLVQDVVNTKIYDSSGKQINENEMKRILQAMGVKGLYQTEETMLKAMKRYKENVLDKIKNIEFSYDPATLSEYKKRLGQPPGTTGQQSNQKIMTDAQGNRALVEVDVNGNATRVIKEL